MSFRAQRGICCARQCTFPTLGRALPVLRPSVCPAAFRLVMIPCPLIILEVAKCDLKFRQIMSTSAIVLTKRVSAKILILRNQKIILDTDLAELYRVSVKRLNEQINRNPKRFPSDFLFKLTHAEYDNLRSQNATSSAGHGGRRYLPHAFTEHGAIMAASVLNSKRAIEMSIFVVRAFVQMRQALIVNQHVVSNLSELEARLDSHDDTIQDLVEAIRELIAPLPANHRRIGFELPSGSGRNESKPRKFKKA